MTRKATAQSQELYAACTVASTHNCKLYKHACARTTTPQVTQIEGKRQTGRRDREGDGPNLCVTPTPPKERKKEKQTPQKNNNKRLLTIHIRYVAVCVLDVTYTMVVIVHQPQLVNQWFIQTHVLQFYSA